MTVIDFQNLCENAYEIYGQYSGLLIWLFGAAVSWVLNFLCPPQSWKFERNNHSNLMCNVCNMFKKIPSNIIFQKGVF